MVAAFAANSAWWAFVLGVLPIWELLVAVQIAYKTGDGRERDLVCVVANHVVGARKKQVQITPPWGGSE